MPDIHPTATVGSAAFWFDLDPVTRRRTRRASPYDPELGADVEVFPHANIDRGVVRPTRIGRGTKIDHFVHVGHDALIGEDVCICAGAIICGLVEIGDRTTVGAGALILPERKVGRDCYIGAGAVVTRDVPENTTVAGVPGRALRTNWPERPWLVAK